MSLKRLTRLVLCKTMERSHPIELLPTCRSSMLNLTSKISILTKKIRKIKMIMERTVVKISTLRKQLRSSSRTMNEDDF